MSYGSSNTQKNGNTAQLENSAWTVGIYHPLTKSLNLVAEYSKSTAEVTGNATYNGKVEGNTTAVGAILFF